MAISGLIIAAPSSGAGKTMITLGLLRALKNAGIDVSGAKSGPDYLDPAFHHVASGVPCVNLDAWAMKPAQIREMAHGQPSQLLLIEGAMGLFDGAPAVGNPFGAGSVADLAGILALPVVLVIDAAKQAQTAAAIVAGMKGFREGVEICSVILNNVGSRRHARMLSQAIEAIGVPVLGAIPRVAALNRPSRHLGLVQAGEDADLDQFIDRAAGIVSENLKLEKLTALAAPLGQSGQALNFPPLGQHIAIAKDRAFSFIYPHMLEAWQRAGASISFFSPLADEGPDRGADAVFLPGGYPELHAGILAGNHGFKAKMHLAVADGKTVYGECGGYMTLGEVLVDRQGIAREMLGVLPVSTSFEAPKMTLGYRHLTAKAGPWAGLKLKAHEFHFSQIIGGASECGLFDAQNSLTDDLGTIGHLRGSVFGSFAHVIC